MADYIFTIIMIILVAVGCTAIAFDAGQNDARTDVCESLFDAEFVETVGCIKDDEIVHRFG